MTDVLVFGKAVQDTYFFIEDTSAYCGLDNEKRGLVLKYAQKIPAQKSCVCLGGNGINVSVGLARLGLKPRLMTVFGNDPTGEWLKKGLQVERVDLGLTTSEPGRQSSRAAVVVYKGERTTLFYHDPKPLIFPRLPTADWLYLSSDLFPEILDFSGKIAFNPLTRDIQMKPDLLGQILHKTEILFVNREEDEALGFRDCPMRVVTDGQNGATVYFSGQEIHEAAYPADRVDTNGAGDAFASGFLAAIITGHDPKIALGWGLKNSASVIGQIGATTGLLTNL